MSPFRRAARKPHHTRKATYQQTRKVFFESLERRDLLASLPVAINDPIYNTPLNTQLTTSTAVVANDFEVDSHSITAAVVDNPSHGTLNSFNTSTGQFVYTPDTSYVGIDTFTYKISFSRPGWSRGALRLRHGIFVRFVRPTHDHHLPRQQHPGPGLQLGGHGDQRHG